MHCDLCIIGAGPGGYRAAEYAAKQGLKVVIFESGDVGGTCLNVGCIPTKTYVHSATFEEARERMAQVVPQLRAGVEGILSHPNITLVREKAVFGTTPLLQEGLGEVPIIIATGSETKWLPIGGIKTDPRVVDSTGLLQLEHLPKKLTIIGAGVIGMEFASVFNRFGSEVTVIEYLKECLPMLDSDIAKRLRKLLERLRVGDGTSGMKRGIKFQMKTAVQSLADIDADIILMATGRKPRTEDLNLAAAGISLDARGAIEVNDNFQVISHSTLHTPHSTNLYAIGDVNGRQMLAHAAEMQAVRAVNHILGKADDIRFDIMPAAIFTTPEAACVGPSEDQLKAQGIPYVCKKSFWRANGKALAMGETEGLLKLFHVPLLQEGTQPLVPLLQEGLGEVPPGLILGCHAYGAHAADIIQEVSVLMCKDTTISELADMVHIHPTLSEILKNAAD